MIFLGERQTSVDWRALQLSNVAVGTESDAPSVPDEVDLEEGEGDCLRPKSREIVVEPDDVPKEQHGTRSAATGGLQTGAFSGDDRGELLMAFFSGWTEACSVDRDAPPSCSQFLSSGVCSRATEGSMGNRLRRQWPRESWKTRKRVADEQRWVAQYGADESSVWTKATFFYLRSVVDARRAV